MSESKPITSGLGPPMPRNSAASQVRSVEEAWPQAMPIGGTPVRTVHASPIPALTPNQVYESILANAVPKGDMDRAVRSPADVATIGARTAAREALCEAQGPAVTSADGERMAALERTVERLGDTIKQLTAKVAELSDASGSFES